MAHFKFDFVAATNLVEAVISSRNTLENLNNSLMTDFKNLQNDFKDDGYQAYASEMTSADHAMKEVIVKLGEVGKAIADYAELLKAAGKAP